MNFSEYFYQNWLDKLVTIIGVIIGVVSGVSILISKISESIKVFKACNEDVKERGKELLNVNVGMTETAEHLKNMLTELSEASKETIKLNDNYKEMQAKFFKESKEIKKIMQIAYTSNPDLVKLGVADEITKIIKGESNENLDETEI